jgi:hypothetical protein
MKTQTTPLLDVIQAKARENFILALTFENGEKRQFDFKPYLSKPPFTPLRDARLFRTVEVHYGTITWLAGTIDFDPETLYEKSI